MSESSGRWIWYPGDFELYHNMLLHSRREEKGCDYPCMWHLPRPEYSCRFYKDYTAAKEAEILVSVKGAGFLKLDGKKYALRPNGETKLTLPAGSHSICVLLTDIEAFPSVYAQGIISTDGTWKVDRFLEKRVNAACDPEFGRFDDPAVFPFSYADLRPISAENVDGGILYDFGRESFGPVTVHSSSEMGSVILVYGESREEACDFENAVIRETLPAFDGKLKRPSRAFRYLYVRAENGTPELTAQLEYLPICDIASFTCDDEKISHIWEICAHTFHLNSREFYLDGIKRDRWCWSGDAYQSFTVNRYLYFEPSIIRRTIRALLGKQPYEQHINTINDYSAYLIIAVWEYYYSTGDEDFVNSVSEDLFALYRFIVSRLDSKTGYVVCRPGDWCFIDWADIDKDGPVCAQQILLWQVYRAMENLSKISDIPNDGYRLRADALHAAVMRDFWDDSRGAFIDSYTSGRNHVTRHAAIFAILYDFVDAATQKRISESVLKGDIADPITTPYFKFFELMALGKMGDIIGIQDYIDSYWGTMVQLGASSVWEQFDPRREGTEHLEMYGEKYGCSLCHTWGAGPIALLGIYCAGVRPTDTAYKTFEVAPNPGRYNHFEAVVPVCGGSVSVKYENGSVKASATVPGGTLYWNGVSAEIPVDSSCVITANE